MEEIAANVSLSLLVARRECDKHFRQTNLAAVLQFEGENKREVRE
jgi:hypothetical protein